MARSNGKRRVISSVEGALIEATLMLYDLRREIYAVRHIEVLKEHFEAVFREIPRGSKIKGFWRDAFFLYRICRCEIEVVERDPFGQGIPAMANVRDACSRFFHYPS